MTSTKMICGIVMPISAIDDCSESHWSEVLEVLSDSINDAGFEANLVSNADDVGLIHKRIIQNLYDNPIVICDVSGKNANVMFELGMRLAFDKPTIIIKDDKTGYSFDTSAIEHIEYPRDLRFAKIIDFKKKLSSKIKATEEKSRTDPNHTTFLKHFGEFKIAKIDKKEVSGEEFIIDEIKSIKSSMLKLESSMNRNDIFNQSIYDKVIRENSLYSNQFFQNQRIEKPLANRHELMGKIVKSVNEKWNKKIIISHFLEEGFLEEDISQCLETIKNG